MWADCTKEPRATLCNVLNRLAYRHSFESAGLAQALHGESRAGIVLAVWRNVIVANHIIELVPGNERLGHFHARPETALLGAGLRLPAGTVLDAMLIVDAPTCEDSVGDRQRSPARYR